MEGARVRSSNKAGPVEPIGSIGSKGKGNTK